MKVKRCKTGDIITDNIRRIRVNKGITQSGLDIQIDKSFNYINAVEQYKYYPKYDTLEKIAVALGVSVKELFEGV